MRCQRCEFENMPGLDTCMRCGSVLAAAAEPIDVHPPRMSGWKKPIRGLFRQLRKLKPASKRTAGNLHEHHFPEWIDGASRVAFFGAFLSLIPGLAHAVQRRFHTIRWWVVAWLIMLLTGLFLFGSPLGLIVLGLAIGIHVWIAVHSALLAEYHQFNYRMAGYLIILFIYFVLYQALGRVVFFNLRGGYSVINVPYAQVHQGDFLLGLVSRTDPEEITRGCFVLVRLENVANHGLGRRTNTAYAQVIGLTGDTVAIENDRFVVNDQLLDAEQYPLPTWLRRQKFSTVVPQGSYFISAQYRGTGYTESQAIEVCVVGQEQIVAKAFLRWMPLRRRGFIQVIE
ncbi:MAG: S26 family signal peptidase [Phycisphaerae bacterium]|nr:S26 family signal peptidase [Phycisphaerae bacterium]